MAIACFATVELVILTYTSMVHWIKTVTPIGLLFPCTAKTRLMHANEQSSRIFTLETMPGPL